MSTTLVAPAPTTITAIHPADSTGPDPEAPVSRALVITAALKFENPRCYVASLVIAFHYDPDTGVSHVGTEVMAKATNRSERHSVRYKGLNSRMWDLVRVDNTGNYYRLNDGTMERIAAKRTIWTKALGGLEAKGADDMLGDGSWWNNLERLGVDIFAEDDFAHLPPAMRAERAGMVGGPVMAQFIATLQHSTQSDAVLLGTLMEGLEPATGSAVVSRKALMNRLGLEHGKSVDRKVRRLAGRGELIDAVRQDDFWKVTPTAKMCAAWVTVMR